MRFLDHASTTPLLPEVSASMSETNADAFGNPVPGVAVGCIMTFMLAAGTIAVPQIMQSLPGGTGARWFTQVIYSWFFDGGDWNQGAAYAFALLLLCILFIFLMMRLFRVRLQDVAR
jgi:spermidine/putrescine transport system permease protein